MEPFPRILGPGRVPQGPLARPVTVMGKTSTIEWTGGTWNPWTGCSKVSPGCKNCYMFRILRRRGRDPEIVIRSKSTFNDPLRWKEPMMVFTCSMSDFFHETADPWRDEAWDIIRRTPQHTYQILTKRPERILECLPTICFYCGRHASRIGDIDRCRCGENGDDQNPLFWYRQDDVFDSFWPNVWLGTSVEMQLYLQPRVEMLTSVPAAVHFLSCEPLLGPLDFFDPISAGMTDGSLEHIEWVITGGESDFVSPRLSPDLPTWFRGIRDQCGDADVPYFHKQNGGRSKCECHGAWGCRLLDGRTYDVMPKP